MSNAPPPARSVGPQQVANPREIRVYGHTMLFYWWPVWLICFLFAGLTWFDNQRLAMVPADARIQKTAVNDASSYTISVEKGKEKELEELKLAAERQESRQTPFKLRVARNPSLGPIFVIVLLLVILITNVPLRGLWSVIVIVTLTLGTVIISLIEGLWQRIFTVLGDLHIHVNMAGYLFIGVGLFVMWIVTFYVFDRQLYMIFTPGQLKVCLEIGGGETAYDTQGMVIQRQRDDLFRHWILGLGSGDLIVRTSGAHSHEFHMANVLNVTSKLHAIEDMMRDKPVVQG